MKKVVSVCHRLHEFLESMAVARTRDQNGAGAEELLVAIYGKDAKQRWGDVFNSIDKNPDEPSEIIFLEHDSSDDSAKRRRPVRDHRCPRVLIRLPKADLHYPWRTKLQSLNKDVGENEDPVVRVFVKMSGGRSAEYYLEYGWGHPLPALPDLDPNPIQAVYVLICAAQPNRSPTSPSRWIRIVPRIGDSHLERPPRARNLFKVELQPDFDEVTARLSEADGEFKIVPHVEPIALGRSRLETLDERIKGAKAELFRMEQRRATLQGLQRDRFHLVLQFRQPPSDDEVPRLADNFQQFLLTTRQQQDRFDYICQRDEQDNDWHIVVTREPVFFQDLNIGLANRCYYQPAHWEKWDLPVFIPHHYALSPRVDDEMVAEAFHRALQDAIEDRLPEASPRTLILLDSPREGRDQPAITLLAMGEVRDLKSCLEFLNANYPLGEMQTRMAAREELVAMLEEMQKNLELEVGRLEHELKDQATVHLQRAQEKWNEASARIDQAADFFHRCDGEFEIFEELIRDFSMNWKEFVTEVVSKNRQLIEKKLAILDELEIKTAEWPERIREVDRGHEEVLERLPELADEMERLLAESQSLYEAARRKHAEVKDVADATEAALDALCSNVEEIMQDAERSRETAIEREGQLKDNLTRLEKQLQQLRDCHKRVTQFQDRFAALLKDARKFVADIDDCVQTMEDCAEALQTIEESWGNTFSQAQKKQEDVAQQFEQTSETIASLQTKIQDVQNEAEGLSEQIRNRREKTKQELAVLQRRLTQLQTDLADLKRETGELNKLRQVVQQAEHRLAQQKQQARIDSQSIVDSADAIDSELSRFRKLERDRFDGLVAELRQTAEELKRIAELEAAVEPFRSRFRHAVRVRHDAIAGLQSVTDEKLKRIWN